MCSANTLKQLAERLGSTWLLPLQMVEGVGMNNMLVLLALGSHMGNDVVCEDVITWKGLLAKELVQTFSQNA